MQKGFNLHTTFLTTMRVVLFVVVFATYGQLLNHSNGENSIYFTNPAAAGMNRRLSVNVLHHRYWNSSLAPLSNAVAFHLPLHFERYGLGGVVFQERSSTSEILKLVGDFSTKIIVGKGYLSYGVRLGISQVASSLSEDKIKNPDDPLSSWRIVRPNLALGTVFKSKKYFAGIDYQLNHGLYTAGVFPYKTYVNALAGATVKLGACEYQPVVSATITRKINFLVQTSHAFIWKKFIGISVGGKSPGIVCPGMVLNLLPITGRDLQIRYTFEKMLRKNALNYDQGNEIQIRLLLRKSASIESIKNLRTTPSPMDFQ